MNEFKHLGKLISLENSIRRKCTGTPDELANQLNVSRRGLHWLIKKLESLGVGVKVDYCLWAKSYYYSGSNAVKFTFDMKLESLTEMTDEEMRETNGGCIVFPFGQKIFSFFFRKSNFSGL